MNLTVEQISKLVSGQVYGNSKGLITGAAGLYEAQASDISFVRDLKNPNILKALEITQAGAVIVPKGFHRNGKTFIEVGNPLLAFSVVLKLISNETEPKISEGIHPTAVVSKSAKIAQGAAIGPLCVVGDEAIIGENTRLISQVYVGPRSQVGKDSLLYPQVVLREDVMIGARCIIHAGAVIGSDGYGFFYADGRHNKIPQVGSVVIEDDVEIGSCTTIDRATTGKTVVRAGTKIDNLVQVAHNVEIGAHSLLAAQVGIAGSSKIGSGVVFGGQVGVSDHTTVGNGVQVGGQSGINEDVKDGEVLFGTPAQPIKDTLRQTLLIRKLPELFKELKILKGKIERK